MVGIRITTKVINHVIAILMTNDVLHKNLTISIYWLNCILQQVGVKGTVTGDKTHGWCMINYERFELCLFER